MTSWEYDVFDAFRARLRVDELKEGSLAKDAYNVFLENPCDEVARILVSVELHGWRPTGITVFAQLVQIHQTRDDNVIIEAIKKSTTISGKDFREEYPVHLNDKGLPPKLILETILKDDYGIVLSVRKPDAEKVYDGLRENDGV